MADVDRIQSAAVYIATRSQDHRLWGPIADEYRPRDVDEAYAVQDALADIRVETLGPVKGYKIALTSPVMQQLLGIDEPAAGVVHERTILDSPAMIQASDYMQVAFECEIAVRVARGLNLTSAPHTPQSVTNAIDTVMPAFEINDFPPADKMGSTPDLEEVIAMNASGAGMVLGSPIDNWDREDLAGMRGEVRINDDFVAEGFGRDVLGHPFAALAWLANHLNSRGKEIAPGSVIITGSIVASNTLKPGDVATFKLGGCEPVRLEVV